MAAMAVSGLSAESRGQVGGKYLGSKALCSRLCSFIITVVCAICHSVCSVAQWCKSCKTRRAFVHLKDASRSKLGVSSNLPDSAAVDIETQSELGDERTSRTPLKARHSRQGSTGSMTSVFDEEEFGQARKAFWKKKGQPTVLANSDSSDRLYSDVSLEEYAPQVTQVADWVKDVLLELAEVSEGQPTGGDSSADHDDPELGTRRPQPGDVLHPAEEEPEPPTPLAIPPRAKAELPPPEALPPPPQSQEGQQRQQQHGTSASTSSSAAEAAALSIPRTALHAVAHEWASALVSSEGEDVHMDALLKAFDSLNRDVMDRLGAIMAPSIKNDNKNLQVVRKVWSELQRPASLHALLRAEVGTGIHKPGSAGMVLRDPSAAVAIVWLRRALAFETAIFYELVSNRAAPMSTVVGNAYTKTLERHHNWVLKSTMKVGRLSHQG